MHCSGREAGKTEAIMGTTQRGENHTYALEGVEGTVFLTDTPGLSEIGEAGGQRASGKRASWRRGPTCWSSFSTTT